MKSTIAATILVSLALGAASSLPVSAEHKGHSDKSASTVGARHGDKVMSNEHAMMERDTHHVLAMAYHQNMAAFAAALDQQTTGGASVDRDFTKTAVTEMRRGFDQMTRHHAAHVKAMSDDHRRSMSEMMTQMETNHSELNAQLASLEREVGASSPNAQNIAAAAMSIHMQLDAMDRMHPGGPQSQMNMKMHGKM